MSTETIETESGPVVGRRDDGSGPDSGLLRFGGVPYAHAERWRAPEPVTWSEPLDATAPGPAPAQLDDGLDLVPLGTNPNQREDALTVEVCTPGVDGARPVLVWVPGGSYRVGGAALPTYDGGALAAHDVVVVGLNYRLGVLGWLAADGVPSNLGLRDLRAAVDWLRAHAADFGGDPDRIVLMGESAGAGSIAHLLAIDPALPVSGAILQSGAPAGTLDAATTSWVTETFLAAAGAASVDELRVAPVEELLAAQVQTVEAARDKVGFMPFHPWIDGDLLTARAHEARLPDVPLVVGTTAHEMELFRDQVPELPPEIGLVAAQAGAAKLGITDGDIVRRAFVAGGEDLVESIADVELHVPNEMLARGHEARGNRVHRYRFTWEAPVRRACHALDLPFTFGTLDVGAWREFSGADGERAAAADALSSRMQEAWTTFAATGTPTDAVAGDWPADRSVHVPLGADPASATDDAVSRRTAIWLGEA
jgi:para-nitrobenzyl esterase